MFSDQNLPEISKETEEEFDSEAEESNHSSNDQESININKIEILPNNYYDYNYNYKLIIIGDSGVGKSCLTNKALKKEIETEHSTIGFEFAYMYIKINDKIIKMQIWDTCGEETYRSLIKNFYRNTSLAFMVYAINDEYSFNNIDIWVKELKEQSSPDTKIFLIGNKCDLNNERKISTEKAKKYAEKYEFDDFFETSAKTGLNAKYIFIEAAKKLYIDSMKYNIRKKNIKFNRIRYVGKDSIEHKSMSCC